MAHVNADLLLIDEVLAVGDAAFQQKCLDTMTRLRDEGRTILLVTHDMSAVERFCSRAMLIDRGRMVMLDKPRKVAMRYTELNFERMTAEAEQRSDTHSGDGTATISGAWFENSEHVRTDTLAQGAHCSVHLTVDFHADVTEPIFGISLIDDQERLAFATTTVWHGHQTGSFSAGEQIELTARFENVFTPGRYFLTPFVAHPGSGDKVMDLREGMISVLVMGTRPSVAVTDIPHEFMIERATSATPEAFETTT
jgi:ABC-type sulfate/molybdate transport systems ATPase subunit